ncbi:sodium-independent anion transporter, partial [Streptomyces sp. NPDC005181]|uniref:sodium-independent anion transporter n=1 Tax=Streptomyces sp. NPDC005181 TaxID=3156869 RepID=UPI0033A10529
LTPARSPKVTTAGGPTSKAPYLDIHKGIDNLPWALRAVANQARMDQVDFTADLPGEHSEEEHALLAEHIVAYRIDGPLFFAGAHRFLLELSEVADVRVVILRMSRVTTMDATGALVLKDAVQKLNRRGIAVMTSGVRPGQRRALESVGALDLLRLEGREYATTPEAIAGARAHLHQAGLLPGVPVTEEASR